MSTFDPTQHNFVLLKDFSFPPGSSVEVFELHSHDVVTGEPDFTRLNTFLTKDGSFITIWNGLLEPLFVASRLEKQNILFPEKLDFHEYETPLFRGYIESPEEAKCILHALRLDTCSLPQVLTGNEENKLACMPIDAYLTKKGIV